MTTAEKDLYGGASSISQKRTAQRIYSKCKVGGCSGRIGTRMWREVIRYVATAGQSSQLTTWCYPTVTLCKMASEERPEGQGRGKKGMTSSLVHR